MRHKDNLKVEGGEFKATTTSAAAHMTMKEKRRAAAASGERAKVVKHQDNLRVGTGEFAKREQHTAHVKGERAEVRLTT